MENGSGGHAPETTQGKAIYVLVLATIFAVALWLLRPVPPAAVEPAVISTQAADPFADDGNRRITIGDRWHQPAVVTESGNVLTEPPRRFSKETVSRALARVELTPSGDVVVDKNALAALDAAFDALPSDLGADALAALQAMIRQGLPDPAGEQTAKIVGDYYNYRRALAEFNNEQPAPADPAAERERLDRLAALRQQYLGPVVAARFFAQDEAYERYVIERRRVEADLGLSADEKAAQHAALKQNLLSGAFFLSTAESAQAAALSEQAEQLGRRGVSDEYLQYVQIQSLGLYTASRLARNELERQDWERRYAEFERERQLILASGLTETDQKTQIDQLMQRLLTPEEIKAVRAYEGN